MQQQSLETKIKKTDNKTVSQGNGDIDALALVNEQIVEIHQGC